VKSISYGQGYVCKLLILRQRFVLSDTLLERLFPSWGQDALPFSGPHFFEKPFLVDKIPGAWNAKKITYAIWGFLPVDYGRKAPDNGLTIAGAFWTDI